MGRDVRQPFLKGYSCVRGERVGVVAILQTVYEYPALLVEKESVARLQHRPRHSALFVPPADAVLRHAKKPSLRGNTSRPIRSEPLLHSLSFGRSVVGRHETRDCVIVLGMLGLELEGG